MQGWQPYRELPLPDGGTSSAPDGGTSPSGGAVVLAMDGAGNGNVLWNPSSGRGSDALYALRYAGGIWGGPEVVASFDPKISVSALSASGTADGHAIAIWEEDDDANPSSGTVEVSTYAAGGTWSAPQNPWGAGAYDGNATTPRIAAGASDDAVAIWTQRDGADAGTPGPARIWGSSLVSHASPWATPVSISQTSIGLASVPAMALAADRGGHAIATWVETNAGGGTAMFARFRGGVWRPGAPISQTVLGGDAIQVAIDDTGRAIAVWTDSNHTIWVARFD
jgi:hypothetical protein